MHKKRSLKSTVNKGFHTKNDKYNDELALKKQKEIEEALKLQRAKSVVSNIDDSINIENTTICEQHLPGLVYVPDKGRYFKYEECKKISKLQINQQYKHNKIKSQRSHHLNILDNLISFRIKGTILNSDVMRNFGAIQAWKSKFVEFKSFPGYLYNAKVTRNNDVIAVADNTRFSVYYTKGNLIFDFATTGIVDCCMHPQSSLVAMTRDNIDKSRVTLILFDISKRNTYKLQEVKDSKRFSNISWSCDGNALITGSREYVNKFDIKSNKSQLFWRVPKETSVTKLQNFHYDNNLIGIGLSTGAIHCIDQRIAPENAIIEIGKLKYGIDSFREFSNGFQILAQDITGYMCIFDQRMSCKKLQRVKSGSNSIRCSGRDFTISKDEQFVISSYDYNVNTHYLNESSIKYDFHLGVWSICNPNMDSNPIMVHRYNSISKQCLTAYQPINHTHNHSESHKNMKTLDTWLRMCNNVNNSSEDWNSIFTLSEEGTVKGYNQDIIKSFL